MSLAFPDDLIEELRSLVPKGERSAFVVQAPRDRLIRERQSVALEKAAGCWTDETHPHLDSEDAIRRHLEALRSADEAIRASRIDSQ